MENQQKITMKKLMIAAATAALAGATFAGVCDPTTPTPATGSQRVYDFKASVKMVDAKSGSTTTTTKDVCAGTTKTTHADYYRVKSSRTFKGIFVDCDACGIINGTTGDNLALSAANFYVASSANKYAKIYEATTSGGAVDTTTGYEVGLLNWIGGATAAKSKVAEMSIFFEFVEIDKLNEEKAYSLVAAGFGAQKDGLLTSVSGNLAGESTAAYYCGYWTQCFEPCLLTAYYTWAGADNDGDGKEDQNANTWQLARSPAYDAVYGTWSVKYNASKSKLSNLNTLLTKTFGKNASVFTTTVSAYPFTVKFN